MSDHSSSPRPVSTFVVITIFIGFGLFAIVLRWFDLPRSSVTAFNLTSEKLPEDLKWKASPESRRALLAEELAKQHAQATGYGWVDKGTGVVRLPIERAMQLVVQENAARK